MTDFIQNATGQAREFLDTKNGRITVGIIAAALALYGLIKYIKRKG